MTWLTPVYENHNHLSLVTNTHFLLQAMEGGVWCDKRTNRTPPTSIQKSKLLENCEEYKTILTVKAWKEKQMSEIKYEDK